MPKMVAMTTWPGRIRIANQAIDSIHESSPKAHIVLTLAEEEFLNKTVPDIHADEIIWIPKNTGPFKKILHAMKKYPDETIISADDDFSYFRLVEKLWDKHTDFPDAVITNFPNVKTGGLKLPNGFCTLYPAHCLDGALDLLTDNIVKTCNDDVFYALILMARGYDFRYIMDHEVASSYVNDLHLDLLHKYHGDQDVKTIYSELVKTNKFSIENQVFLKNINCRHGQPAAI